jgi:hypothetical protein
LKLKTLLILAAIVSVCIWVGWAWKRSAMCRQKALQFSGYEAQMNRIFPLVERQLAYCRSRVETARANEAYFEYQEWSEKLALTEEGAREAHETMEYIKRLKKACTRVAWRPWEHLPSESPLPSAVQRALVDYQRKYDPTTGHPRR